MILVNMEYCSDLWKWSFLSFPAILACCFKILGSSRCRSCALLKFWEHVLYSCKMVFILLCDQPRRGECSNLLQIFSLKVYFCCKMITSQNVLSEARLRIFLFYRNVMFRSQDISVFVFLTIPWFTKSAASWWVHEARCILNISFKLQLINSANMVDLLIDITKRNIFLKSIERFGRPGLSSRPCSIWQLAPVTQ